MSVSPDHAAAVLALIALARLGRAKDVLQLVEANLERAYSVNNVDKR